MKRSRLTEEQEIVLLQEHEVGAKAADVCHKHAISSPTFYAWKARYGGLDVLQAVIAVRGRPLMIVSDDSTELTRLVILQWGQDSQVEWHYTAPGKPQ